MDIAIACTNHECPLLRLCATYMDHTRPADIMTYRRYLPITHGNQVSCTHFVRLVDAEAAGPSAKAP